MRPLLFFIALTTCVIGFAQEITIKNNTVFAKEKAVLKYSAQIRNSPLRYDIQLTSLNDEVLISASIQTYRIPVPDVQPFDYYELIFPTAKDTFAIAYDGPNFIRQLSEWAVQQKIIQNDAINDDALQKFKRNHVGQAQLIRKIKKIEKFLNDTRYLHEQVVRDRTAAVSLDQGASQSVIYQDGKRIGLITRYYPEGAKWSPVIEVRLANERLIYSSSPNEKLNPLARSLSEKEARELFEKSNTDKKHTTLWTDDLMLVSRLIASYAL